MGHANWLKSCISLNIYIYIIYEAWVSWNNQLDEAFLFDIQETHNVYLNHAQFPGSLMVKANPIHFKLWLDIDRHLKMVPLPVLGSIICSRSRSKISAYALKGISLTIYWSLYENSLVLITSI